MACAAARAIRRRGVETARPGGLLLRRRFRWCWSAESSRRLLAYGHTPPLSARRRAISSKTRKSSAQLVICDFGSAGDRGHRATRRAPDPENRACNNQEFLVGNGVLA